MGRRDLNRRDVGFTMLELLIAMGIAAMLLASIAGIAQQVFEARAIVEERNGLQRDARFAMGRMTMAVSRSTRLLLPFADVPNTNWREDLREQTVPPTPPTDDSSKYTAVLAVTLPEYQDLDRDGFPDADDDRDGRIDEDLPGDKCYDFAPGIYLIDDDGDGEIDEGNFDNNANDDERLNVWDEDRINGVDDDGDGNIDEDPPSDMNDDNAPGIAGVDDDGDGQTDEGNDSDDDEDGQDDEDWYNPVVFYLDDGILKERIPVGWDISGGGLVGGQDFITADIAEKVTRLRIERLPPSNGGEQLIDITLELTGDSGAIATLRTRMRLGAAL